MMTLQINNSYMPLGNLSLSS